MQLAWPKFSLFLQTGANNHQLGWRWDIRSPWTLCDAATRFECLPCFPTSCEFCVSCLYSSCILLFVSFLFCIYCTFCSERLDEMNLLIECSKLAENKRGRVRCLFTCSYNIWHNDFAHMPDNDANRFFSSFFLVLILLFWVQRMPRGFRQRLWLIDPCRGYFSRKAIPPTWCI